MDDFLVTRVIGDKSIVFPRPKGYYLVEIRSGKFDFPFERKMVEKSAKSFDESFDLKIAQRIATIVSADSFYKADKKSEALFIEVLDCLDIETRGLGKTPLLKTGFLRNLDKGVRSPRLSGDTFGPFPSFKIEDREIPNVDIIQALLSLPNTELKSALFRSYHWLRKAKLESTLQLKNIFRWFALETLAKVKNLENINPKIMQALGFPLGLIGLYVKRDFIKSYKNHEDYLHIERFVKDTLKEMRDFRNNTVHSGFRQWDISDDKLYDFKNILLLAVPRLQKFVIEALFQDINRIEVFWEYFPLIFNEMKNNIKNDFHGTVLYSLKNRNLDTLDKNKQVKFDIN